MSPPSCPLGRVVTSKMKIARSVVRFFIENVGRFRAWSLVKKTPEKTPNPKPNTSRSMSAVDRFLGETSEKVNILMGFTVHFLAAYAALVEWCPRQSCRTSRLLRHIVQADTIRICTTSTYLRYKCSSTHCHKRQGAWLSCQRCR